MFKNNTKKYQIVAFRGTDINVRSKNNNEFISKAGLKTAINDIKQDLSLLGDSKPSKE